MIFGFFYILFMGISTFSKKIKLYENKKILNRLNHILKKRIAEKNERGKGFKNDEGKKIKTRFLMIVDRAKENVCWYFKN